MTKDYGIAAMQERRAAAEAATYPETLAALVDGAAADHRDTTLAKWLETGQTMTYAEFAEASRRLASSFLAQGIRKGTHVAVMLPNVPAYPLTWVALGRIGAVMIPVNIHYTQQELTFVLTDADAQFLVIDETALPSLDGMAELPPLMDMSRVILRGGTREGTLDWDALLRDGAADFTAPSAVSRTDMLNLQYTSGTTGFPKGCMLSHDYWVLLGALAAHWRGAAGDVRNVLIWAPFNYMDPQWQFLMTMCLGGTAKIAPRISLSRAYDIFVSEEIHYCIFPEPALKAWPEGEKDKALHLKYVSIFGWREDARQEVERRFGCVARESFGMTEVGGALMVPEAAGEKAYQRTCGLPAAFREVRIVDDSGKDVAQGEIGELWVAGRGILWGYYKRPQANAEGFSGRWFRTGDLFRQDDDGFFQIVGRIKDMIRRSGENIAAQEVEAVMNAMPGVMESAAVGVPEPGRGEEVKVYLLLADGKTPADVPPEAVIEHCSARLAKFKTPRFIAYVDAFPRTVSNKIRKNAILPEGADPRAGTWDRVEGRWLSDADTGAAAG
ncbi:Long-chain-fatty-acid--CoA ligase (plasmid) [Sulfitobacter sp. THAF37]|uniref:class I adenylate-forming enzyme family protein n=1 Tax=Sulfitobacter sp. THAF37 TaxID=2587855 RepID=UPI001267C212|nr:class I adenylate-forming enzyme family protein [Sulfitobacter sp. THAF37]QFT61059.1 Long-chain-fatty-acid--CoA ligase [Sulfitobacter sp. THAF37]